MTVAAVIVPDDPAQALGDATGRVAVRRIIDSAWAGGAFPIMVVSEDPTGQVATALEGSAAVLVGADVQALPARFGRGAEAALETVHETSAVLLWPGRMTWTDPETVTSLIEAHGRMPGAILRPRRAGQEGWPVLVPADRIDELLASTDGTLEAAVAGVSTSTLELGDPGSVIGVDVAIDALPDYAGPPEPVGGPPPEWGAAAAEMPEPELGA
jgi:CTP:molybdopterin cytidylyltransferase MocA